MPLITLWFLQSSRSIRIAWLLEELGLDYNVIFFDRTSEMKAPEEFKSTCGNPLGKAPVLQDGDITIYESGAITEYLCEQYDKEGKLVPKDIKQKIKVLQWIHAAEATFLLHGLAVTYARENIPTNIPSYSEILQKTEQGLSANVLKDLQWLEDELLQSQSKFLCGDKVTAADTMMQISLDYIISMKLGMQKGGWPTIEKWLKACEETETYKRAVEKTGYEPYPSKK